MTDTKDLVERLRSVHVRGIDCHCREAADEIERLRASTEWLIELAAFNASVIDAANWMIGDGDEELGGPFHEGAFRSLKVAVNARRGALLAAM